MKHQIAIIVVATALLGCASAGRKIDQNAVATIQKGKTTQSEVKSALGSPEQITRDSDGNETWVYIYSRATVKGSTFIPIVGAFAGGVNTQNQSTVVKFGPDKVVSNVETSFGGMSVDNGLEAGGKPKIETEQDKRQR